MYLLFTAALFLLPVFTNNAAAAPAPHQNTPTDDCVQHQHRASCSLHRGQRNAAHHDDSHVPAESPYAEHPSRVAQQAGGMVGEGPQIRIVASRARFAGSESGSGSGNSEKIKRETSNVKLQPSKRWGGGNSCGCQGGWGNGGGCGGCGGGCGGGGGSWGSNCCGR